MNYFFCGVFLLFFLFILPTQEAQGQEALCNWTLQNDISLTVMDISYSDTQKVFTEITGDSPLVLNCIFDESVSLKNKLIGFDFQIKSTENYDLKLLLEDINGNTNYVSSPIRELYDIAQEKQAHVVLDPADFEDFRKPAVSTGTESDLDYIKNVKLELNQNNFESVSISTLNIIDIENYPNYNIDENLPIQSTIPGFFALILVSFPLGFVVLNYSNFLREENFFVKIPWFLGFGFCFYMVFIYLVSQFWISFEVVLGYVIFELVVLVVYLKKIKTPLINFQDHTSRNIIIFFSIILIIAGALSINYIESIGWPTGIWDSRVHTTIISLTVENNILDDDIGLLSYPKAAHAAAAGLSLLSGTVPAAVLESVNSFVIFLIPVMLSSLVFKFSKSIFLTSIIFVLTYWVPQFSASDIMYKPIITSNLTAMVGIIITLTSLMIFVAYFEKGHKFKLFICFSLSVFALAVGYYGFVALPILIGVVGILMYYLKNNKKRIIVFSILAAIFISMPLWSFTALELVGEKQYIPYVWERYASSHPFDPSSVFFPLWVSSAFGLISAGFLFKEKKYRPFSIVILLVSLVHLLPISHDLALYYDFYYKSLRSIGLMFLFSISINLVMIHFITKHIPLDPDRFLSKLATNHFSKIVVFGLFVLLLFPGLQILDDRKETLQDETFFKYSSSHLYAIPGGNERNLQYWLYENTKSDDLILNDLTHASGWFLGFRAQSMLNGWDQDMEITRYKYDEKYQSTSPGILTIIKANEILKHPWDYKETKAILTELDIHYLYISERDPFSFICPFTKSWKCYSGSEYWPWRNYSGDARIEMYENHPNLELVLRNGNSAVFKVM